MFFLFVFLEKDMVFDRTLCRRLIHVADIT